MQAKWIVTCGAIAALGFAAAAIDASRAAERSTRDKSLGSDRSSEAAPLVQKALAAAAAGDSAARANYLQEALSIAPNDATANWQAGNVRIGDAWLSADAAAAENAWSGRFAKYKQLRNSAAPTADAQLKLARWCADAGLKDQEQQHLHAALQFARTQGQRHEVMTKLGLVRYQKTVMPAVTAEALKQKVRTAEAAMTEWKPRLTRLREDLESRDTARQQSAREQLLLITDPAAVAPIEAVFAKAKPEAGVAAVAAIAGIKQQVATDSLVRHAVLSQHEAVRQAAAEALRPRSVFSYVPMMLSSMGNPIEITFQAFSYAGGAFGERLTMFREGPLYSMSVNSEGTARPAATPVPGAGSIPITGRAEQAIAERAATDAAIATAAMQENARTEFLNTRIGAALRIATGNDSLSDDAKQCWDWWTDYNETHYATDKPTYEINRSAITYYSAIAVAPPSPTPNEPSPGPPKIAHSDRVTTPYWLWGPNGPPPPAYACFVPGTKVWTITGTAPIEKVQVGDWVLSQDVDTGELGYKPVAAVTHGTPLPLIEIRAGEETIRSTVGHLFWVDGAGWKMAKELKPGDRLHTTRGSVTVETAEQKGEEACHNLIVPDFNTYFVTDDQILVHDINIRAPTDATIPGYVPQQDTKLVETQP